MSNQPTDAKAAAREFIARGWSPIPIPHRSKNPNRPGWQSITFTLDDFGSHPINVGVHLGPRSGNLTDVDLDHLYAVQMADLFIPQTDAVFGRPGKPRSHRLFITAAPIDSKPYKSRDEGTIVEIRASGQTVFPASTHPSGEPITWEQWPTTPATIDPAHLRDKVEDLHRACLARLAMARINIQDGKDGSRRLHAVCCRCVEHDLDDADSLTAIRFYEQDHPFPREWSDEEILQRLSDAEKKATRGQAVGGGKIKASQADLTEIAREILAEADTPPMKFWRGILYSHQGGIYRPASKASSNALIFLAADQKVTHLSTKHTASLRQAIEGLSLLPDHIEPGTWLIDDPPFPADEIQPLANGLFHLPSRTLLARMPDYFNVTGSPARWDADAPPPGRWLSFLKSVWSDDLDSIRLLQQWFGYVLTNNTRQQKMLLMIGPKRSGKGTVARVLRGLLGDGSVCGPTLASLSERFGLAPLLNASLAIISDARLSGRTDNAVVVERLLSISGEDALTVDRKHIEPVTSKLPVRVMMMTNEVPRLNDVSGALASRFLMLRMRRSFIGKEDIRLTDDLLTELPGILNWAVSGFDDLTAEGRFIEPEGSVELSIEMEELQSPVLKFLRERCSTGADESVPCDGLFASWRQWCGYEGRTHPGDSANFGRQLRAALPDIRTENRRTGEGEKRRRHYCGVAVAVEDPDTGEGGTGGTRSDQLLAREYQ